MQTVLRHWAGPGILFLLGIGAEMMPIQNWLWSGIFWALALVWFVYWLHHRHSADELEVRILPSQYLHGYNPNPYYGVTPGASLGAHFNLVIINHDTKNMKVIESGNICLKKKRLLLWDRALFSVPVTYLHHPTDRVLQNLTLNPHEKIEVSVSVHKQIPVIRPFPRKSQLLLVLKMVGAIRELKYKLDTIRHDPKQVPDIPDWKMQ